MVKKFIPAIAFVLVLGSCSSLKQLGFSANKQQSVSQATSAQVQNPPPQKTNEVKFLDNISSNSQTSVTDVSPKQVKGPEMTEVVTPKTVEQVSTVSAPDNNENTINGNASVIQMKYAVLMNTDVEKVQNLKLFEYIDDWYGTRYCLGGTTKDCIDCSAFVQSLFAVVYGISLPRTSKYQYTATRRISTTQLKEGDLLFFHTRRNRRGVTHVGIYLQNNKFVQASSSGGVKISDMYEPYYVQHLIGAGRAITER
ncbi:MAG: C40 family peptidase [Chitinophagales bacterium]